MLNYDRLVGRLQMLMKENELTASSFADKIGVQRSSISHILSGRNKPSLDFLAKIEHNFDRVSFHWLLTGDELPSHSFTAPEKTILEKSSTPIKTADTSPLSHLHPQNTKTVVDMVFVYSDGSFERFHPKS